MSKRNVPNLNLKHPFGEYKPECYTKSKYDHKGSVQKFRDNWDKIFGKKEEDTEDDDQSTAPAK